MKNLTTKIAVAATAVLLAATAWATNGDDLIGVGPISRAMGGVGIAAPQDAISAVFANPAAMCFTPGCAYSEVNFAGTVFLPKINAVDQLGNTTYSGNSRQNVYAIPAIGLSVPIDPDTRRWRFGLAAYGVTGLGVDYRGTALDQTINTGFPAPNNTAPLVQGAYTSLMIMKFAPSISYEIAPNLSFGAAMHVDYATLDLGNGSSPAYGIGAQFGAIWRPIARLSLGAVCVTPQSTKFRNVLLYQPGDYRDLEMESPTTVGVGVAYSFFQDRLLAEVDGKYLNWSDAAGYKDFGWQDQWVVGVGVQFAAIPKRLFLRVGYNFGNNPVKTENGWGAGTHNVQGMAFPDYYYQTFRVIGFPAIAEHHVTAGLSYAFSEKFELNLDYTHAFENGITENGQFINGTAATLKSTLSENSIDFGLTWRF